MIYMFRLGVSPYTLIFMAVLFSSEWIFLLLKKRPYDWRQSLSSLLLYVLHVLLKPLDALLIAMPFFWVWNHRWATIDIGRPLNWIILMLAVDFTYYWSHRTCHKNRWMWATHTIHHTAQQMNYSMAIRIEWFPFLSGTWIFYLPLLLIGFSPFSIGGALAINLLYQFVLHTSLVPRLWWPIEWLLNTPSNHRTHHLATDATLNCNFGGILILFDRMFGTYIPEPAPSIHSRYGLIEGVTSNHPLAVLLAGWKNLDRDILRKKSRPASLFQGPAWQASPKPHCQLE